MNDGPGGVAVRLDADELVLFEDDAVTGDTFIFEPSSHEAALGSLFLSVEAENRDGVGRELIDTVVQALQREYYRDPARGVLASFESALHQANLVLHDISEQGVRDWMGSFHAGMGVLSGTALHISTAGEGSVLLTRANKVTEASVGLSHSPITDPLRTFSQVASGTVTDRDVLFFGTSQLADAFRHQDLARAVVDHSAATISLRLQQLYEDQRKRLPMAVLVVSIQTGEADAIGGSSSLAASAREPISHGSLSPRKPLVIHYSLFKRLALLAGRMLAVGWRKFREVVWPNVKVASKRGGSALFAASKTAGRGVQRVTNQQLQRMQQRSAGPTSPHDVTDSVSSAATTPLQRPRRFQFSMSDLVLVPRRAVSGLGARLKSLPPSSKIFAVIAIVLAVALILSLVFLQRKRAEDVQIQQASELLHEARTKQEAAETALIYDNREQARALLHDSELLAGQIKSTGLYLDQVVELERSITAVSDRLEKVTRVTGGAVDTIGDFGSLLTSAAPTHLFFVQDSLYSFDPSNNTIVKMNSGGETSVVSTTTSGVGFFVTGAVQTADKSIVLVTDSPGIALFDTKSELLQKLEIDFPSSEPNIASLATFGSRLYLYDQAADNIYGYSKTLRGYSGGDPWITEPDFARNNIEHIGVDGYIYTMHENGTVRKLLKGAPVDFEMEQVEPPIPGSARMLINEDLRHIYMFDRDQRRVVIFDTEGNLNGQYFLPEDSVPVDIAVDPSETKLYVLDGTKVLAFSLTE